MSEFLMVVPPDWYEVQNIEGVFTYGDADSIQRNINAESFGELEQALIGVGEMIDGNISVWGARLFNDGIGYRLWVRFGPLR